MRDVFALVFLAAAAATTIAATNGVTTLWLADDLGGSYGSSWLLWWIGDAMGVLVVAPLLLVWITRAAAALPRPRSSRASSCSACSPRTAATVFLGGAWRYPHLLFPLLVWAALRFRQQGASAASFVVVAFAVAGAVHGSVPLGQESATKTVQIMEALFAAVTVTLLLLGAVLAERADRGGAPRRDSRRARRGPGRRRTSAAGSGTSPTTGSRGRTSCTGCSASSPAPSSTYEEYVSRLHPEDAARDPGDGRARLCGGSARSPSTTGPCIADGSVRWLHGRGRAVRDETGTVVRMVGTAQDITERRRIDELRDTILATVSHELRTPLTAITGFAITLKERGDDLPPELRADIVDHLTAEARRLETLLSDLLDLDRLRLGLLEPTFRDTDVGELVARVAAGYQHADALDVRTTRVVAAIDPPKVERMVENLLVERVQAHAAAARPSACASRAPATTCSWRSTTAGRECRPTSARPSSRSSAAATARLRRAPASGCHWSRASRSCTAAAPGWRTTRAAARRSASACRGHTPVARGSARRRRAAAGRPRC